MQVSANSRALSWGHSEGRSRAPEEPPPEHTSVSPPPLHPTPRSLTFWKLWARRALLCRPHTTSRWASRSRSACGPLCSSRQRPRATARRLCTRRCHALTHLDSSCRLGMDGAGQGVGLPLSPRAQQKGLPSIDGLEISDKKALEAGECLAVTNPRSCCPPLPWGPGGPCHPQQGQCASPSPLSPVWLCHQGRSLTGPRVRSPRRQGEEPSQPQLWPHRALSDSRFTGFPALFLENKRTRQLSGPKQAGQTPLPSLPQGLPF